MNQYTRSLRFLLLTALFSLVLSSCMVTHQQLYEQSFSCDGVWVERPNTIYQAKGKNYVQGIRAQFVHVRKHPYVGLKESIKGPSEWYWKKKKGSEGEPVYREVDDIGCFKQESAWVSLDLSPSRTKKLKYPVHTQNVDENKSHLTPRAFYGLPGAALCFIPDMAAGAVMWTAYGTGMAIQGIVLLPVSRHQQQVEPVSGEKPVVE